MPVPLNPDERPRIADPYEREREMLKWRSLERAEHHFEEMEQYMDEEERAINREVLRDWRRSLERGC